VVVVTMMMMMMMMMMIMIGVVDDMKAGQIVDSVATGQSVGRVEEDVVVDGED